MAGLWEFASHGSRFYLGTGWPQWMPLDTPGTHRPFSWAASEMVIKTNSILLTPKKSLLAVLFPTSRRGLGVIFQRGGGRGQTIKHSGYLPDFHVNIHAVILFKAQ